MTEARKSIDPPAAWLMTLLCAIWGLQQVVIKLAAPSMSPLLQVGVRSGVAASILLALVFLRGEQGALRAATWKPGAIVGVLFGLEFLFVGEGLRLTSASHMAIFLYTAPIFAALGLHWKKPEERLSAPQWTGIAVAFGGVVSSFAGWGGGSMGERAWLGDLLGIAAGAAWGATTLTVRVSELSRSPATVTLFYQLAGGFVLPSGAAMALDQTAFTWSAILVGSLFFQVVVVSVISYLVWFTLLRTYLASRLGVLSFMTPVFGIGFGVLILGEWPALNFAVGALLILGGILVVSGRELLGRRQVEPAPR